MRGAAALALAALAGCVAAAAPPAPAPAPVQSYHCLLERSNAAGRLRIQRQLAADGTPRDYTVEWVSAFRLPGVRFYLNWAGARLGPAPDDVNVGLYFNVVPLWRGNRKVRIELRRNESPRWRGDMVLAGRYFRARGGDMMTMVQWDELRGFARGAPAFNVVVIDERQRILARDRPDPAMVEAPDATVAAAAPEFEAILADYRNRCTLQTDSGDESDIIVT